MVLSLEEKGKERGGEVKSGSQALSHRLPCKEEVNKYTVQYTQLSAHNNGYLVRRISFRHKMDQNRSVEIVMMELILSI